MSGSSPPPEDASAASEFTQLHSDVAPRLWAWVAVRLGPGLRARVETEDVVQEVACRAWRRFGEFDAGRGSFEGWTFGIARNVLGELLTRMARGRDLNGQWSTGSWERVPDDATQATATVAQEEHVARFVQWTESLNSDDRRLVLYRGLEGSPHAAVAELLEIREDALKKRWERLRGRLAGDPHLQALLADNQGR